MPFDWFRKPEASRKYIDLIKEASSKWANWDPPNTIQAGDFGSVDKKTGQFERIGNIYKHPETAEIAQKHLAVDRLADELYVVNSFYARRVAGDADINAGAANIANVKFSAKFNFENHRGAFLVMHNPRMSVVPDEFCQEALNKVALFKDAKFMLVKQTFVCDGYLMYLSSKKAETVQVSLGVDAPTPTGASVGTKVGGTWATEGGSGTFRRGYSKGAEGAFTPLYHLKAIQPPPPKRRESPDPDAVDGDRWDDVDVPWDALDSDGDEEPEDEFSDEE